MVDIRLPQGLSGWLSVIAVVIIVWLFLQTSTLLAWAIGAAIVLGLAYIVYVVLYRTNKALKDKQVTGKRRGGQR